MSYCRFSSDNFGCDLYCYEDFSGGWTTHVAGRRVIGIVPQLPDLMTTPAEEWCKVHNEQMAFLSNCQREDITLPFAGQSFNDETLVEFADRITMLVSLGYRIPKYTMELIEEELADHAKSLPVPTMALPEH